MANAREKKAATQKFVTAVLFVIVIAVAYFVFKPMLVGTALATHPAAASHP